MRCFNYLEGTPFDWAKLTFEVLSDEWLVWFWSQGFFFQRRISISDPKTGELSFFLKKKQIFKGEPSWRKLIRFVEEGWTDAHRAFEPTNLCGDHRCRAAHDQRLMAALQKMLIEKTLQNCQPTVSEGVIFFQKEKAWNSILQEVDQFVLAVTARKGNTFLAFDSKLALRVVRKSGCSNFEIRENL